MTVKEKEFLYNAIQKLKDNKVTFQITSIALIEMMVESGDLDPELGFYGRIVEAILNDDPSLSYDEMEQFLAMHMALIEVYNDEKQVK